MGGRRPPITPRHPIKRCRMNLLNLSGKQFLVIGFFLVLFGFLAPFLMVIHVIQSTFWLSFLSYAASMIGLMFGLIGAVLYVADHRKLDK